MESKNLVICDPETKFASAFAQYLTRQKELAVRVRTCSDPVQSTESADFQGAGLLPEGAPGCAGKDPEDAKQHDYDGKI